MPLLFRIMVGRRRSTMLFIVNMLRIDSLILFSRQVWNLLMSALSLITLALTVYMVFNADLTHSYLVCVGKEELFRYVLDLTRVTLIVPAASQAGRKWRIWDEIWEEIIQNEVRLGEAPQLMSPWMWHAVVIFFTPLDTIQRISMQSQSPLGLSSRDPCGTPSEHYTTWPLGDCFSLFLSSIWPSSSSGGGRSLLQVVMRLNSMQCLC